MKKFLLCSICLLLSVWAHAQITVTVTGTVTRSTDGTPVEDWEVAAFAIDPQDSTQFGYAEGLTDALGNYSFEVEIPDNLDEITIEIETGCYNGSPETITEVVAIANDAADADFEICADHPLMDDCEASFEAENVDSLQVQFTAYFEAQDSAAAFSWLWDFGDGNTSTEENPLHTYDNDGLYEATLTIISETGCEASSTEHVCVGGYQSNPECEAWFEVNNIDSLTVQFTSYFESQDSAAVISWLWDFGDGNTSTEENPTYDYAAAGVYEVTLTIVSETGCEASSTEHVCVGEVDPDDPDCSLEPVVVQIDSLTFAFSVEFNTLDSAGAVSWIWDFGDGNTSTDENPVHTYDQDGFYIVTIVVTSATDCEAELSFPLFTDTPPSSDCAAYIEYEDLDSLTFVFNSEVFGLTGDQVGVLSYFWDFDDGTFSNDSSPTHIFPGDGIYSVELTVVTEDSCLTFASAVVVVGNSPVDTFFYGCQAMFFVADVSADSLTMFFEDLSFGSPTEWFWEFGDGETSDEQNPEHTYDTPGVYLVELSILTSTGCESNISFEVCVKEDCPWQGEQDCQALFIPLPDSLGGLGFEFVDLSYAPNPIQAWSWDFGDGETSNEQNPFHEYAQHGVYSVTLSIESDSCASEITFELDTEEPWNFCSNVVASLGVATGTFVSTTHYAPLFEALRIFPNPAMSTLNLVFEAKTTQDYKLQVLDFTGRALSTNHQNTVDGMNLIQLNIESLLPGIYLLELRTDQAVQVIKFVKQ